jgi:hypothetical protein
MCSLIWNYKVFKFLIYTFLFWVRTSQPKRKKGGDGQFRAWAQQRKLRRISPAPGRDPDRLVLHHDQQTKNVMMLLGRGVRVRLFDGISDGVGAAVGNERCVGEGEGSG